MRLGLVVPAEVVVDVAEVEVPLEDVGIEADGALVERQRLDQLVVGVVDVGEVDERGHQRGVDLERPAVRQRRPSLVGRAAVVERRGEGEVLLGQVVACA